MANTQTLITEVYSAFNQRNIDGALALMSESVSWPKASEGGRVGGKEEIRAYWSRQWKEFDPHVEPIEVIDRGAGKIDVRVHQLVKSGLLCDCSLHISALHPILLRRRCGVEESSGVEANGGQARAGRQALGLGKYLGSKRTVE